MKVDDAIIGGCDDGDGDGDGDGDRCPWRSQRWTRLPDYQLEASED